MVQYNLLKKSMTHSKTSFSQHKYCCAAIPSKRQTFKKQTNKQLIPISFQSVILQLCYVSDTQLLQQHFSVFSRQCLDEIGIKRRQLTTELLWIWLNLALEMFLNDMCYICSHFTYLLTYLLTGTMLKVPVLLITPFCLMGLLLQS